MSRVSSFQVLKRETGKMLYFTSYLLKAVECFADTFMKTRLNAACYDGTHHQQGKWWKEIRVVLYGKLSNQRQLLLVEHCNNIIGPHLTPTGIISTTSWARKLPQMASKLYQSTPWSSTIIIKSTSMNYSVT
jgi:hypothetical protein